MGTWEPSGASLALTSQKISLSYALDPDPGKLKPLYPAAVRNSLSRQDEKYIAVPVSGVGFRVSGLGFKA